MSFDGYQIANAEDGFGRGVARSRGKHPCVDAVVNDCRIYRGGSAVYHIFGNFLADAYHSRRRTIHKLRNVLAPFAGKSMHLVVKEWVQAVDGDDARNIQLAAQEHRSMPARQRSMSMDQINPLATDVAGGLWKSSSHKEMRQREQDRFRPECTDSGSIVRSELWRPILG